ncbi:tachykinin-like peptides receptor 86C [Montipora capricornis]|uniref:tachykinin-like peptides receptor 86C n=1 Tax=Montipora capricornis TaxID=246305 RepID=UPI0035F194AA
MLNSLGITVATVSSLIATTSTAGNLLVCFVVIKNRDMRTPFNFLLLNLAVADIIYSTFHFTYLIYRRSHDINPDAMLDNGICFSLKRLAWIGADCSVFTMIAIANERYWAAVHPLSVQRKLIWRKLKVIIPATWILSALINMRGFLLLLSFGRKVALKPCTYIWLGAEELLKAYRLIRVIYVGISSLLMIGYYSIVVYTLWFKRDDHEERPSQQQGVLKVRKRVTLMVLTVTALFEICWIPDTVMHVLHDFGLYRIRSVAFDITHTILALNSAVNPFAYALINQRFREKMKGMLCNRSCASEENVNAADNQLITFRRTLASTFTRSGGELCLVQRPPTRDI